MPATGDGRATSAWVSAVAKRTAAHSGTRSQKTDWQFFNMGILSNPPERSGHTAIEQGSVKYVGAAAHLFFRQKIEKRRSECALQ